MNTGVQLGKTFINLAPAGMQQHRPAARLRDRRRRLLRGRTPQGVRYTRDGQFTASASGQLVDGAGNPVLGQCGAPIAVGADGTVPPGSLGVFNVPSAVKQGENLYTGTPSGHAAGTVRSGVLEESGVEPRAHDGRNDRLPAHLPVRPAGHPGDRPDPPGRLHPGWLPQRVR